eukprot:1034474-Pelagomonas_calceolata.AAC.2
MDTCLYCTCVSTGWILFCTALAPQLDGYFSVLHLRLKWMDTFCAALAPQLDGYNPEQHVHLNRLRAILYQVCALVGCKQSCAPRAPHLNAYKPVLHVRLGWVHAILYCTCTSTKCIQMVTALPATIAA